MPEIPKSVKTATQILGRQHLLRHLYSHSQQLLTLQDIVRGLFPGDVFVASCRDGTLHLITASSALATRLRYSEHKLLNTLRSQASGWQIEHIRISVRPDFKPEVQPVVKSAIRPSPENARQLESTAQYIEDDNLRKALIRLARRTNIP